MTFAPILFVLNFRIANEPNNYNGAENTVLMNADGTWNDYVSAADKKYPFVCQYSGTLFYKVYPLVFLINNVGDQSFKFILFLRIGTNYELIGKIFY